MKVGFIGLGSVGGKLAGSLVRNGVETWVHDLDLTRVAGLVGRGAVAGDGPAQLMEECPVVITCLPSPAVCAAVVEEMLPLVGPGKCWIEMSTTDAGLMARLAAAVEARGGMAAECPVSGGCHRAGTGNISIFVGGSRAVFDAVLPVMSILGRQILHTGPIGSASVLKVMTNYLATVHLIALTEALTVMKAAGIDLATAYEAIRISSGNSFTHETESQMILNGSRDINFTMGLVRKDVGLFQSIAEKAGVPLELSPLALGIFDDGIGRFGADAQSDRIIERLEAATGLDVTAPGFPDEMVDDQPEAPGKEVVPGQGRRRVADGRA